MVGTEALGGVHRGAAPVSDVSGLVDRWRRIRECPEPSWRSTPWCAPCWRTSSSIPIHPFGDGNGRVSRLVDDGILYQPEYNVFGFYGLSTYFYRHGDEYKRLLQQSRHTQPFDLNAFVAFGVEGFAGALKGINNFIKTRLNLVVDRTTLSSGLQPAGRQAPPRHQPARVQPPGFPTPGNRTRRSLCRGTVTESRTRSFARRHTSGACTATSSPARIIGSRRGCPKWGSIREFLVRQPEPTIEIELRGNRQVLSPRPLRCSVGRGVRFTPCTRCRIGSLRHARVPRTVRVAPAHGPKRELLGQAGGELQRVGAVGGHGEDFVVSIPGQFIQPASQSPRCRRHREAGWRDCPRGRSGDAMARPAHPRTAFARSPANVHQRFVPVRVAHHRSVLAASTHEKSCRISSSFVRARSLTSTWSDPSMRIRRMARQRSKDSGTPGPIHRERPLSLEALT